MSVSIADLQLECITKLKSCPVQVVNQRLYWACRRFFELSEVWTAVQTQNVVAAQESYTLSLGTATNAEIKRLAGVWYGTSSADMKAETRVDEDQYEFVPEVTLTFYEAYQAAVTSGLTTKIVLIPKEASTSQVPGRMMDEWAIRGILPLAIWNLKMDKDQPWEDEKGATAYENEFRRGLSEARLERFHKRKGGDLRVVPRWFS
jgi:hypothetical protein